MEFQNFHYYRKLREKICALLLFFVDFVISLFCLEKRKGGKRGGGERKEEEKVKFGYS